MDVEVQCRKPSLRHPFASLPTLHNERILLIDENAIVRAHPEAIAENYSIHRSWSVRYSSLQSVYGYVWKSEVVTFAECRSGRVPSRVADNPGAISEATAEAVTCKKASW